jgi:hypothetical protein
MTRLVILAATLATAVAVVFGASGIGTGMGGGKAAAGGAANPVLIELFTSQGCSSCPPADQLLARLPAEVNRVEVLPLAFHVDYWDDLGWRDPFSRAEWTARQRGYAHAIADERVYTPQLVIQGGAHVVGSDRAGAVAAIRAAAARPAGARIAATASGRDRITVAVDAGLDPTSRAARVWVAVVESGLSTRVERGENRGRTLANPSVVRHLVEAFAIEAGRSRRGQVTVQVDPAWRRDRLSVIVFLQQPDTLRILAAARAR